MHTHCYFMLNLWTLTDHSNSGLYDISYDDSRELGEMYTCTCSYTLLRPIIDMSPLDYDDQINQWWLQTRQASWYCSICTTSHSTWYIVTVFPFSHTMRGGLWAACVLVYLLHISAVWTHTLDFIIGNGRGASTYQNRYLLHFFFSWIGNFITTYSSVSVYNYTTIKTERKTREISVNLLINTITCNELTTAPQVIKNIHASRLLLVDYFIHVKKQETRWKLMHCA